MNRNSDIFDNGIEMCEEKMSSVVIEKDDLKSNLPKWKRDISNMTLAYEYRRNRLKYMEERNSVLIFFLTTVTTTISLTQFNLNETDYPELSLGIKILFTTLCLLATMISGWQKIRKYSDTISSYSVFLEKLRTLLLYSVKPNQNNSVYKYAEKYDLITKDKPHMNMNTYYLSLKESKKTKARINALERMDEFDDGVSCFKCFSCCRKKKDKKEENYGNY